MGVKVGRRFTMTANHRLRCRFHQGPDQRLGGNGLHTRAVTAYRDTLKEFDFALIIVSHVNDLGQTRGSRCISKVADIRIDLKRDLMSDDPIERNTTRLSVSKNRYCGRTGSAIPCLKACGFESHGPIFGIRYS